MDDLLTFWYNFRAMFTFSVALCLLVINDLALFIKKRLLNYSFLFHIWNLALLIVMPTSA